MSYSTVAMKLALVASLVWFLAAGSIVYTDYQLIQLRGKATLFVGWKDRDSGRIMPYTTLDEMLKGIHDVYELRSSLPKKARTSADWLWEADAVPVPYVRLEQTAVLLAVPIAVIWLIYFGMVWAFAASGRGGSLAAENLARSSQPEPEDRTPEPAPPLSHGPPSEREPAVASTPDLLVPPRRPTTVAPPVTQRYIALRVFRGLLGFIAAILTIACAQDALMLLSLLGSRTGPTVVGVVLIPLALRAAIAAALLGVFVYLRTVINRRHRRAVGVHTDLLRSFVTL